MWRGICRWIRRSTCRGSGALGVRTERSDRRTDGDEQDYAWGLERFLGEARMLARFKDPHIVQVYRVIGA